MIENLIILALGVAIGVFWPVKSTYVIIMIKEKLMQMWNFIKGKVSKVEETEEE